MLRKMLAVVGPTASGKSALAVEICKRFGGEIVSCDSMQIYKKMNIGTAKPTKEEMGSVPHHLIDFLDVGEEYSVSDYVCDAEKCADSLQSKDVLPVFCGGTGLYITSFLSGMSFSEYENDPEIRKRLNRLAEEKGAHYMHKMLSDIDEISARSIDENNVKRVIRAIEVYENTGITMSEHNRKALENAKERDCLILGLDYLDRQKLYDRIDMRVDKMMRDGLLDEVRELFEEKLFLSKTASQAIGYKEFLPYLEGSASIDECVEVLKRNSRRYAKRQLTWFRRNEKIEWIFRDGKSDDEVFNESFIKVQKYLSEE